MNIGHNKETEDALFKRQQFLKLFGELNSLEKKSASANGLKNDLYKRAETFEIPKSVFEKAKKLNKDEAGVVKDLNEWLLVFDMMGLAITGSQLDMFKEPDGDAKAKYEGYMAGALRKDATNPYDMASSQGQAWQENFNIGHAFVNKKLSEAVDDDSSFVPGEGESSEESEEAPSDQEQSNMDQTEEDDFDAADPNKNK